MKNNVVKLHIPPRKPVERKIFVLDSIENVERLRAKLAEMGRLGFAKHFNHEEPRWLTEFDVRRAVAALGFDAVQAEGETFIVPLHVKHSLKYDFSLVTDQEIDEGMAPWSYYELGWESNLHDLYPSISEDYEALFQALGEQMMAQFNDDSAPS